MRRLKSGKTWSKNARNSAPEEIDPLEKKRDYIKAQIENAAQERLMNRLHAHMTAQSNRMIAMAFHVRQERQFHTIHRFLLSVNPHIAARFSYRLVLFSSGIAHFRKVFNT